MTDNLILPTVTIISFVVLLLYAKNTESINQVVRDIKNLSIFSIVLIIGMVITVIFMTAIITLTPLNVSADLSNPAIVLVIIYGSPLILLATKEISVVNNFLNWFSRSVSLIIWKSIPSAPTYDEDYLNPFQINVQDKKREEFIEFGSYFIPLFVYLVVVMLVFVHGMIGLNIERAGISLILLGIFFDGMENMTDKIQLVDSKTERKQSIIDLSFGWASVLLIFSGSILQLASSVNVQNYTLIGNILTGISVLLVLILAFHQIE